MSYHICYEVKSYPTMKFSRRLSTRTIRDEESGFETKEDAINWILERYPNAEEDEFSKEHGFKNAFLVDDRTYSISGYRITDDGWTKRGCIHAIEMEYLNPDGPDCLKIRDMDKKLNELGYELDPPGDYKCRFVVRDIKTKQVRSFVSL